MDTNKLISLIDATLLELDNAVAKSKYYHEDKEPILSTKKVLLLLKDQVQYHSENINERVLRAMHDLGMSAYKDFENTPLEDAIGNVTGMLYHGISRYKTLAPLREDFGKGNPI